MRARRCALRRLDFVLGLLAVSLQAAYATVSLGPNIQSPDIHVPASSVPQWYAPFAAHTNHLVFTGIPASQHAASEPMALEMHGPRGGGPSGYWPSDILSAYNVPAIGGANLIAIVDAFDYRTAKNDFNVFSTQFGLPVETGKYQNASSNKVFQVIYQGNVKPTVDDAGWNEEAALDIEWAHAMAPNAKIVLFEAHSNSYADLLATVQQAAKGLHVNQISMSWGGGEFSSESAYDSTFVHKGVVFFASSGDSGGITEFPSVSPNVVAVGGTSLYESGGVVSSETAWSGAGGGPSAYEARPSFQNGIASIVGSRRGVPDIAAVANPYTGVAVYDSTPDGGYVGWLVFGGTSVACPVCAGITNNAGSMITSSAAELTKIYGGLGGSNFRDIVSGSAGAYTAGSGWDYITGVGAPLGTAGL